ncbi:MAG: GAF domain-containing protein [Flavobacteriales bacterium]|nr:GAF domain-containing protein [Bacteroidota bacterium]MCB9241692.1 GAF domain-containing protein [Flavobacteriales bacterium]
MVVAYIAIGILAILLILILLRLGLMRKKIQELRSKTDFASAEEEPMMVTFEGGADLENVATNFNRVVKMVLDRSGERSELMRDSKEKNRLDAKVREFETSMSSLTVLTDIGRRITASLNIEEIISILYDYVQSTMFVDGLELLYFKNEETVYLSYSPQNGLTHHNAGESHHLMEWSLRNKKDVYLDDAKRDYGQYVDHPIKTLSGMEPGSVICIPMMMHEKEIGAIAVLTSNTSAYNAYHKEFIRTLASYVAVAIDNSNVYQILEQNKDVIEREKAKSEDLLLNILPAEVADELKEKGKATARNYDNVTVLFTDFVNFTGISESLTPAELVEEIDYCFRAFDEIIGRHGLEKIKTIGDAYLAVAGLPMPQDNHAARAIQAAVEIREFMAHHSKKAEAKIKQIRIGLSSGPVVAGVVGNKKFAFDIWGDTVNTAARMEQQSEPGKINVTGFTQELIKDQFKLTYRGKIQAKNKGEIDMYFVEG